MANLKLIGAVAIKVRPDTSAFRRETQDGVDRELGHRGEKPKAKVKVDVELDTTQAKRKYKTLEEEMDGKTFKLNVGLDYDSVQKAKQQIDQSLNSLKNHVIPFELKRESLLEAKRELKDLEKNATVDFKFVRDEAGYQSILNKIKKIREQKGLTSTWHFKTDTKSLREAELKAKSALRRLEADKTVTLSYSNTFDGIKQAVAEVDKRLNALRELKLKTKLDAKSLEEAKAKLLGELQTAPVTVKFNEDKAGYEKVLSRIKQIQMEKIEKSVTFETDDESLKRVAQDMRDKIRALDPLRSNNQLVFSAQLSRVSIDEAKHKAEKLKKDIEDMKASMKVQLAGSALVAAQLRFLGRDRIVNYIARVSKSSIAVAEGVLKSLGGINTLSSLGKGLENLFTKFDTASQKAIALATALGSVADVGVYAGTAIFRIGEGAFQSLGLLAAAPAVLGAAAAGYTIFTAAFNNFFDAFNKDPKIAASALAALPPVARKTVDSITGLYKGLANPIQERFWTHVGDTLSDSITKLYPNLKARLLDSTDAVGDFVAGFGRSMNKLVLNKDLDKMFDGFKGFFVNLSKASEPFFDAWNRFGVQGAQLLPMFGDWIAKMAVRFDDWSKSLGPKGITDMIMHGVHSLQEMWKVGGDVTDIFKAITRAAGLAGTGGLAQFQVNLRKIADTMLAEPWQSKAATIFEGARRGASGVNAGFKDLTSTLGSSAVWLGNVLDLLGQIGGESLSRLSDVVSGKTYQDGVTAELTGMQTLISGLSPAFASLGNIIGNMGIIAGSVLSNLAPVINQVAKLLDTVTTTLATNIADVAPKMAATVGGVFRAITPLVLGVTNAINSLLTIVGRVPDSFVTMGVAATAFFALRALSGKFYESLAGKPYFKNLEANWLRQQSEAGKTATEFRKVNGEMQKVVVPTERYNAAGAALADVRSKAGGLRATFRDLHETAQVDGLSPMRARLKATGDIMRTGVQSGASSLLGFLGGPWGAGLAVAGLAIGAFAQQQQDSKQHVDDLTASIDRQTGQLNKQGLEKIAASWTDIKDSGDAWANAMRFGTKAANESASMLGLNLANVTKTIAEGGAASDTLVGNLDGLAGAMRDIDTATQQGSGLGLDQLTNKANDAAGAFGLTYDKIQEMGLGTRDIEHLASKVREEATAAKLAKAVFEGLADATGTSTIQAQQMATAMQTIGNNSIDASQKIGAINKALDLLKGGKLSAREAEVKANQSFQTAITNAAALKEELAGGATLINQTTGLIDTTSSAGLKLQQTMSGAANDIKTAAMAAYQAATDAGKPPAEAMAAAQAVIAAHKDDLKGIATAAGVDVGLITKEWEGFFGTKWELNAVFSASADKFEAARKVVQDAGLAWDEAAFEAVLKANPDPAKMTTEQAQNSARDYANGVYKAQLDALPQPALDQILRATGTADAYKRGDYTAVMKAWNSTDPGVQAAIRNIKQNVTEHGWAAAIKVLEDAIFNAQRVQGIVNGVHGKTVSIGVDISPNANSTLLRLAGVTSADGSILDRFGNGVRGFNPGRASFQAFANGGITVEKPGPAKIYSPVSQFRLFAEASTGGEAFIPLAASKRNRSTEILAEVASQFGYKLQKATAFADGGIMTGGNSHATRGLNVHIGTYNQNANDTVDDVARGIMRQARSAGVTGILDGI